jgi:hypothetical protein
MPRPAASDTARYQRLGATLQKQGLIETIPPVDDYAVELEG